MKFILFLIFSHITAINTVETETETNDPKVLHNKLLSNLYFIKESVDTLQDYGEATTISLTNQNEILEELSQKYKFKKNGILCSKIAKMLNSTFGEYEHFENRMFTKLQDLHNEQDKHLNELWLNHTSNTNCVIQDVFGTGAPILASTLKEISEKLDKYDKEFEKMQMLDVKMNSQQTKFDNFAQKQLEILQDISDKLIQHTDQLVKINQEVKTLNETNEIVNQMSTSRLKLPMDLILDIISGNKTSKS